MSLVAEDFPAVFAAIHGYPPFAWQTRLLQTVIKTGWPATIAAPTGAGKTAVLDIALFHLAIDSQAAPRRIVIAVDRRVIVDQAHQRATHLRAALAAPSHPLLTTMAKLLSRIAGGDQPLHVEVLRGGMPREDQWARSPVQPTILSTTVDQLGSRLLFRGYGVASGMAPIHAGLLGEDALLFLDEAHLSNPFRQTLQWVGHRRRAPHHDGGFARPWAFASLTATPATTDDKAFVLNESERTEATIARRLAAPKSAELLETTATYAGRNHVEAFVGAAAQVAKRCPNPAPIVAIIVNRVALARSILVALQEAERDTILLTGRVRPVERDDLINSHAARLQGKTTTDMDSPPRPLFVVATQCIEAGADFDFSAMVTQIAPLDALRQRFGRLNRQGLSDQGPAAIIATKAEIARNFDDPLYGKTLRETWEWLSSRVIQQTTKSPRSIEVGPASIDALVKLDSEAAAKCVVTVGTSPVLRPADIAFFAMTQPKPHPDPCLPLFLHGKIDSQADVSIIWRADCEVIDQTKSSLSASDIERMATAIVACFPPKPGEAINVPIWAANAWLNDVGASAANIGDAEADATEEPKSNGPRRLSHSRYVLRWRGPDNDETKLLSLPQDKLAPGDVIIVPASYGGCDRFGWSPGSSEPVPDIADRAAEPYAQRSYAVRLHRDLWTADECLPWAAFWAYIRDDTEDRSPGSVLDKLMTLPNLPPAMHASLLRLKDLPKASRLQIDHPYPADNDDRPSGAVIIARGGIKLAADHAEASAAPATEDDLAGSYDGSAASLAGHSQAVRQELVGFAAALGFPADLAQTLAFAGLHHDDGKADPRFQQWLGREEAGELLAKSARPLPRAVVLAARTASGLPPHWRHEALSVRIAGQVLHETHEEIDAALALYLIGTHHGFGRPFFAHDDPWDKEVRRLLELEILPGPGPERLDFNWRGRDWAELSSELQSRYGVWGLAFLESLLRLADHRVSGRVS